MWLLISTAAAADWLMLQGTELGPDPAPIRPWGFVHVLGEGIAFGPPVEGLSSETLAPFNDERASFNRVGSSEASWGLSIRRARAGLRGALPKTDGGVAWMVAGASGFRDVGLQVFDSFEVGSGSLSYAAMLSNGRMGSLDVDNGKDLTGRVSWAPVVWGEPQDPHRDEVGIYGFWQQGTRTIEDEAVARVRRGGGVQVERSGWHARVEVIQASGVIETGSSPPFPGQPVVVATEGEAVGGYAFLHYGRGHLGGGLRYDQLWRLYDSPADLRVFRTLTADVQVEITPKARILFDYELRWLDAPDASADVQAIVATLGDRVSVQAGVVF